MSSQRKIIHGFPTNCHTAQTTQYHNTAEPHSTDLQHHHTLLAYTAPPPLTYGPSTHTSPSTPLALLPQPTFLPGDYRKIQNFRNDKRGYFTKFPIACNTNPHHHSTQHPSTTHIILLSPVPHRNRAAITKRQPGGITFSPIFASNSKHNKSLTTNNKRKLLPPSTCSGAHV